jgi:hypothetical protein
MNRILIAAALMATFASGSALAQSATPGSTDQSPAQTQQAPTQPQSQPQPQATPPAPPAPASAPPDASQAPAAGTARIAPGSVIPVQLTKTIDARKAKPGDEVVAIVTMDLKSNSGEVVLPKDTKVVGHVTEAQARGKEQKESQVGIAFDHAVLKSGDVNLPMSIQAIIAPPTNNAKAGGGDPGAPAGGGGAATSPMGGGRSGSMESAGRTQPSSAATNSVPTTGADTQQQGNARPPINGNTQGVVGISNLKLEAGQNATQGSVLSSEKNNVKVESGTMLLLKVNP